ncbi:hypothetical protein NDU88_006297 [Pleurodeles waltl]|uniref:Uncharacterized protein n=1 Tax=Pleurodeles waltl TaxID=8319 RepID=A0AAV7MZ46_PLEWA|nr:hypothetical protein NDU88_006297 [Pleurodeles waltl]
MRLGPFAGLPVGAPLERLVPGVGWRSAVEAEGRGSEMWLPRAAVTEIGSPVLEQGQRRSRAGSTPRMEERTWRGPVDREICSRGHRRRWMRGD